MNNTGFVTIVEKIREYAKTFSDKVCIESKNKALTYKELDDYSDYIAGAIQGILSPEELKMNRPVGLLLPLTEAIYYVEIGIQKTGLAYMPLSTNYPFERISYCLSDSNACLLITTDEIISRNPELKKLNIKIETIEKLLNRQKKIEKPVDVTELSPANIFYTSGSTGKPKGVCDTHGAVVELFKNTPVNETFMKFFEGGNVMIMTQVTFTASLLNFIALYNNCKVIVPSSEDFSNQKNFADTVVNSKVSSVFITPSFFKAFSNTPFENIIFSNLKSVLFAGEKLDPSIVFYLIEKYPDLILLDSYGSTETCSAIFVKQYSNENKTISIGKPLINVEYKIIDSEGNPVKEGEKGELIVSGRQIAKGYIGQAASKTSSFVKIDGKNYYKTGDIVCLNSIGEIQIFGRNDDMVKFHGQRVELGEIEEVFKNFPGIKNVKVMVKNNGAEDFLAAFYVAEGAVDKKDLMAFLKKFVASYMIPQIYVQLEKMPLNQSGKLDRMALQNMQISYEEEYVAPETDLEKYIAQISCNVLGKTQIGVNSNLIFYGMTSLSAMKIASRISEEKNIHITAAHIINSETIRNLAERIENITDNAFEEIPSYAEQDFYPLSSNQLGLFLEWNNHPETVEYNIEMITDFDSSKVSVEKLKSALEKIVENHAALRIRFVEKDGEIFQKVLKHDQDYVVVEKLDKEPDDNVFQSYVKPYNLLKDRLFRFYIFESSGKNYLFADFHHTISDGLSSGIFFSELKALLNGESIKKEDLSVVDYALFESEFKKSNGYKKHEEFFQSLITDVVPAVIKGSKIDSRENLLPVGVLNSFIKKDAVDSFCKKAGVTVSSFMHGAFNQLLYKFTRETKPLYLTASNGRSVSCKLENTMGFFVKTLPVAFDNRTDKNISVIDYVKSVNKSMQHIFENELYAYNDFVEKTQIKGDILFLYQGGILNQGIKTIQGGFNPDQAINSIEIQVFPDDENYIFELKYDGTKYTENDMTVLMNALKNCALSMTEVEKLSQVSTVSESEKADLIQLGKGKVLERDEKETILSIFKDRVSKTPDATALVFRDKKFTYAELDKITDKLAVYFNKNFHIHAEENVGVLISRSELMLIYPLAIMKNGAAYMPLDPTFPTDRLSFMCEDAEVKLILSENNLLNEKIPDFAGYRFNSSEIEKLPEVSEKEVNELKAPDAHNRFVIIFTSGSTGKPKAVELEHYGIVNFSQWYAKEFSLTEKDRIAGYANFGFDAHMIDLYPSILSGSAIYIFDDELRHDIPAMNEYMEENKISVAFITTQVGCLISEMNHSLRCLSTGGEKMPPVDAPSFRFLNVYGPTECSLFSTYYDVKGHSEGEYIGKALSNYQIYVVDQNNQLVPHGIPGELLICGQGVARGYMKRPELTAEKFIMFKAEERLEAVKGYRSGDLVRWSKDGNIEFLGRIDKQVKLRGLRIELGEIETRAAGFEGIKQVVVDVKNDQLCCYYVSEKGELDKAAIKAFLAEKLTEFMVPEVYMQLEEMPLNPNGKVDRKKLPEPEVEAGEIIAPETEMEKSLFKIISDLLGTDNFGVTTNLVTAGLSSLKAMKLSVQIQNIFECQVKVPAIMKNPVVRGIAALLEQNSSAEKSGIVHDEGKKLYPITENQRGLYVDWEMNQNTVQYNIPTVLKFNGKDSEKIAAAVRKFIELHSGLKTNFVLDGDDIMQKCLDSEKAVVTVENLTSEPAKEFFQSRVKPFNLLKDRLYRAEIYVYKNITYLFLDVHHIIFDGLSLNLFITSILDLYDGKEISKEEITAYDFALYEKSLPETEDYKSAENYFNELVSGGNAVVYPDSKNPDGVNSATVKFSVEGKEIDSFCSKNGITASSYFNAVCGEALKRITREEKPVYITVSNGRESDGRLLNCTGMFVKTLPVVHIENKDKNLTVSEYVKDYHEQLQQTISNNMYPYTSIVEKFGIKGEVMFDYSGEILNTDDLELIDLELDVTKTPVGINVSPKAGKYEVSVEYDGNRYGKEDMLRLARAVGNLSVNMTQVEKLSSASLVSESEKADLIQLSAGEKLEYDASKTWLHLFEEQTAKTPDSIAVVDKEGSYTYKELSKKSDIFANILREKGVKEGEFIVLKFGRSKDFLTAVIAAHKIGAAFVPVDADYPEERINYIQENSEAKFILTEEDLKNLPDSETKPVSICATPDHIAYMIYTSGSTGKPKGVMIPHRALMNFVNFIRTRWGHDENSRCACHSNFAFDACVEDLYPLLICGGTTFIVPEEERKDIGLLKTYLKKNKINTGGYSTQFGQMLGADEVLDLKYMTLGGEKMVSVPKVTGSVYNTYGPTEFTVDATYFELDKNTEYEDIPIGRPLFNSYGFVLDSYGNLMPEGMTGELCLYGSQIAAGYWKLPEKTAEVFVDCSILPGKMYRTGDLVRYNKDSLLEYLGRIDFQVKLRGFRIELGEIETRAKAFDGMSIVNAQVKHDNLVLYYTATSKIDTEKLRSFMEETLADYMIPSVFMQLDQMPMTPNGKIDRKKLPEPEIVSEVEYVAPQTELQQQIVDIYKEVLKLEKIGINDNFFKIGGTSIAAMKVIIKANTKGMKLTYKLIFDNPTPAMLEQIVLSKKESSNEESVFIPSINMGEFTGSSLKHNKKEFASDVDSDLFGNILLLGATGFLGIHVLHSLLNNTRGRIYCLVRGKKSLSAKQRLKSMLMYYFDSTYNDMFDQRIVVVEGEFTDHDTIMQCEKYDFDMVVNCAACVKHFASDDILDKANVQAVQNIIDLCIKKNTKLIHVSTESVAGDVTDASLKDKLFGEDELYFNQILDNKYCYTKFMAEKNILTAVETKGLKGRIIRVGNLMPRYSDGEFQINFGTNSFIRSLKAFILLGCIPEGQKNMLAEFSPIDFVADAVCKLTFISNDEFTVFHLHNQKYISYEKLFALAGDEYFNKKYVSDEEFNSIFSEALNDPKKSEAISVLMTYNQDSSVQRYTIAANNEFTNEVLNHLGFVWPQIDRGYISRVFKGLKSLGFFK